MRYDPWDLIGVPIARLLWWFTEFQGRHRSISRRTRTKTSLELDL